MFDEKHRQDSQIESVAEINPIESVMDTEFNKKRLTLKEKLSYASGQLPGMFYGAFMGQIQAFYVAWMYLHPIWILVAQIIYGFWNLINDPIFGVKIDSTRTPEGRLIPWIKKSAIPFTIAFVLVFLPPGFLRTTNSDPFNILNVTLFIWYLVTQMIYDTFFTIAYIAHTALLPQMTMNQEERRDLTILSSIFGIAGVAVGALPFAFLTDPTPDKIKILQIIIIIIAVLAIIPWYFVVKNVKELPEFIPPESTPFLESIKHIFRNPSGRIYIIYDGVSVGVLNFLMTSLPFILAWIFGQNSAYTEFTDPDWSIFSIIPYFIGPVICFLIGLKIEMWIPTKYDVKSALMYSLICEAIGFIVAFVGAIPDLSVLPMHFHLPPNLWLVSVGLSIVMLGLSGDFIYHNVMRGETIDADELITGERREAVYAGVGCILSKPMISVALATVPLVMAYYGLTSPPDYVLEFPTSLYPKMGFAYATFGVAIGGLLIPGILALIGAIAWRYYPLTREVLEENHKKLQILHDQKRQERLNEDGQSKYLA